MPASYQAYWVLLLSVFAVVAMAAAIYRLRGQVATMRKSSRVMRERFQVLGTRTRQLEQANHKLQRLSYQDGLTGVANRRHFDEVIDLEWRRARRVGTALSLIMIDIDDFKAFNDAYGHQFGDECLVLLTSVLRDMLNRPGDVVARYGGEEFVMLLPETSAQGAAELAEAIRARIEGMKTTFDGLPRHAVVTISLGVATHYPTRGSSSAALIAAADQALYLAKDEGRNRVVISGRPSREMEKTAAAG